MDDDTASDELMPMVQPMLDRLQTSFLSAQQEFAELGTRKAPPTDGLIAILKLQMSLTSTLATQCARLEAQINTLREATGAGDLEIPEIDVQVGGLE